jgi:hypothetical protein
MPTTTRAPRTRRAAAPQRRGIAGGWLQRGRPQPKPPSSAKKALTALTGALPGRRSTPAPGKSRRAGKTGGLAVLAGAAGLAFKNRDRISALIKRKRSDPAPDSPDGAPTGTPATTGGDATRIG